MNYNERSIYVAIGGYNESYLEMTIRNCIEMAKYPERLNFGVWSHNNDGVVPSFPDLPNVRLITVQHPTLLGTNPSRLGAQLLYDEEYYYLQVDAHSLFVRDWDTKLIHAFENIVSKEECKAPIITTYTPWWYVDEDDSIKNYDPDHTDWYNTPLRQRQDSYTETPIPMYENFWVDWSQHEYYEHYGMSGHFLFTRGFYVRDVRPDIDYMFYGEEHTAALRAWTRGYRIFITPEPIVWHWNKGMGKIYKYDRWSTIGDERLFRLFERKQELGHEKAQKVLTGEILGYWGAPTLKDLKAFEEACGIDFKEFYKNRHEFLLTSQSS